MNYSITDTAEGARVTLDGQLNFATNVEFQHLLEGLVQKRPRRVVFDLAGLTLIDSVGLGLLYIAHEDLAALGGRLCLKSATGHVARLLELTEAGKTFDILP